MTVLLHSGSTVTPKHSGAHPASHRGKACRSSSTLTTCAEMHKYILAFAPSSTFAQSRLKRKFESSCSNGERSSAILAFAMLSIFPGFFLFSKIPSQLYATGGSGAKKRWAAATGLLKKMVQFLSSWIAASYLSLNFYFAFIFILLTNNFYFKFPR